MRFEQLEYILEVANKGSIGNAAHSLFISQQSLSQSIKNLENELEMTLFERTKEGVKLTEAGELFCQFAKETLSNYTSLKYQFRQLSDRSDILHRDKICIEMNRIFDYVIMPNVLKSFQKDYPEIILSLLNKDVTEIYNDLRTSADEENENYIAVVNLPCVENKIIGELYLSNDYIFHSIFDGELKLCVNKVSRLAKKRSISLEEIAKYPIVFLSSGTEFSSNTGLFFQHFGIKNTDASMSTTSMRIWLDCLINNRGVGLLHGVMFEKGITDSLMDMNNLAVLSIDESLRGILGYIIKKKCSKAVETFVKYIPQYNTSISNIKFNK